MYKYKVDSRASQLIIRVLQSPNTNQSHLQVHAEEFPALPGAGPGGVGAPGGGVGGGMGPGMALGQGGQGATASMLERSMGGSMGQVCACCDCCVRCAF
jgi:hypothetical protein